MIYAKTQRAPADFTPLFLAVTEEMRLTEPLSVELLFVGEKRIRDTNREFRGVDRVTDVLSFPALDIKEGEIPTLSAFPYEKDEDGRLFLGSLMVCAKRCREQAKEYGHGEEREFNYLICHGLLHLLGYDHIEEADRVRMREKEEAVMARMNLSR